MHYNSSTMITNIGTLLKNEREKKGISLEDVEKDTHVRLKNLVAIENEEWDGFPSRTYIQGIIKRYGRYLEMDEEKLIAYFRRDYERLENVKFKERTTKSQFTPQKKRLVQVSVALIILLFSSFFGYQMYLYLKPPEIVITEPTETVFKRKDKITLSGTAPAETVVTVNGVEVFLDEDNTFTTDIPLTEENNPVVIEATGANGKKTVVNRVFEKEE